MADTRDIAAAAARLVERTTAEQGLPVRLEDAQAVFRVVSILRRAK